MKMHEIYSAGELASQSCDILFAEFKYKLNNIYDSLGLPQYTNEYELRKQFNDMELKRVFGVLDLTDMSIKSC